jgi:anti-sigma factor RsiW
MRSFDCAQLADVAPELALDNLSGDERAAALAHLETCPSCRELVSSLTSAADQLLLLAPKAEPPAGFEERVLAALAPAPARPAPRTLRHRLRRRPVVAALALAASIVAGALVLGVDPSARPALAAAEMRTSDGQLVGEVFVHREDPVTLFMTLPGWSEQIERYGRPGEPYSLRVESRDGNTLVLPVTLNADAAWATTLDVDPDTLATVAVLDSRGYVWCQAEF